MLGLGRDSSRWLCVYFPVSWLTQFGHGLVTTVVGPTQPYLAKWVSSYVFILILIKPPAGYDLCGQSSQFHVW